MSNEKQFQTHYRLIPVEKVTSESFKVTGNVATGIIDYVEPVPDSILLTRQELEEERENAGKLLEALNKIKNMTLLSSVRSVINQAIKDYEGNE